MTGLTVMQAKALDAIRAAYAGGVAPSYREIGSRLGLASVSNVHRLIEALEARGKITRHPRSARSIEIVGEEAIAPLELERLRSMQLDRLREEISHAAGVLGHRVSPSFAASFLRRLADQIVGKPDGL